MLLRRTTGQIEEALSLYGKFVEAARASMPESIEEASRRCFIPGQRAVTASLCRDSRSATPSRSLFRCKVRKLQGDLTTLAGPARRTIFNNVPRAWAHPMCPSEGEFQSFIRGAPVFEPPSFSIVVSRPALAGLLGSRAAGRQLADRFLASCRSRSTRRWRRIGNWCESGLTRSWAN